MQEPTPTAPRQDVPFPLQEGETILRLFRRHWIYLWPNVSLKLLLAVLPPIVALIAGAGGPSDGAWAVLWVGLAANLVYWLVRAFLSWYRYHNDIWVVTNQRLIDSYKPHPFSLRVATADLVNLQDMTVVRSGVLRTLLDFGDVVCQTASEMQEFRLTGVPDPRAAQALVDRERDRERMRSR
jgi:hypothetical protein